VDRAAARVAREWSPTFSTEDLIQEAYIACATRVPDVNKALAAGGLGVLHNWVYQRLTDFARKENRRTHLNPVNPL
jgi:hypothetical protein